MNGEAASLQPVLFGAAGDDRHAGRDADLMLYDRVIARVRQGENYYAVAVAEQRARNFPVRPGLAVRLPTLTYLHAWLGARAMYGLAISLFLATIWAWRKRMGEEPGGRPYRNYAAALIGVGGALLLNPDYAVLHEVWAGMLVALSFALHRPGRWAVSLAVAAAALALRELALPYVVLMAAMAFWRGHRTEGASWSALATVFLLVLWVHVTAVAHYVLPSDPPSPGWFALNGYSGWLSMVVISSSLRFLPHLLAGPLAVLMVFGWSGWRSDAGTTATFLFLGYALAFMLAGRANNFYWGFIATPAMWIGMALMPMALRSLLSAAWRPV